MIERTIDTELSELNGMILKMANMVEASVAMSIEALKKRDEKLSDKVIQDDNDIDRMELEIDDKCVTLLATRQPMATDLRFITTALKIVTDLERIGDLSVDISQRNKELLNWPLLKPLIDIPKLAEIAREMIRESIDSFVKRDGSRSLQIHDLEKESDKLRDLITDELIEMMTKDCSSAPRALPLMLIARHLERICDHSMNIAEDVVYMVEAKVVKHLHQTKE